MKKIAKFFKTVFVDNILLTLLSVALAVALCIITAVMA